MLLQSLINVVWSPSVHNHIRLVVDGDHITIRIVAVWIESSLLWIVRGPLTLTLVLRGFVGRPPILPEQSSEGVGQPTNPAKVELLRLLELLEGRSSQLV